MYPPVQNLISVLEKSAGGNKVYVITTHTTVSSLKTFLTNDSRIKIKRLGWSGNNTGLFKSLLTYLLFYISSVFYLLVLRPGKVLYFETISSFPAWLYKRLLNAKAAIFIHYHEYTTPLAYSDGMYLTRNFHALEKWLYPKAAWVSQTNHTRLSLFEKDILPVIAYNLQVLPNYPPQSWGLADDDKHSNGDTIKVVYTGALSMDTMFTKQFAEFINAQNGQLSWDIYSYNISPEASSYLAALNSSWIRLNSGVDYNELPKILAEYDVGVILYNGHIANYVYNAPNKLFEYFVCGLYVWYPDVMKGITDLQYEDANIHLSAIDFTRMVNFNWQATLSFPKKRMAMHTYTSEQALEPLVNMLCN